MKKGNVLIGQSGGPTAVINASLYGLIEAAREVEAFGRIYGMEFAIEGFMEKRLIDLRQQALPDLENLQGLMHTPGSALGSSRYKLKEEDLPRIRELLEEFGIRYLFLIGGNDTMDTIHRVENYCRESGYELTGIGVPKTVDNDLYGTDHTPGFASAARYIALSVQQAGRLADDMQRVDRFAVFQTVGREAGWLAAASALAKKNPVDAPHLVFFPERPLNREKVLTAVKDCVAKIGWCYIVVGEGCLWENGTPVSAAREKDGFANTEFGAMGGASAALSLHSLIREETGYRGEFQITESLPMCAVDRVSEIDREEACRCGRKAVELAVKGRTGVMVTMKRVSAGPSDPYRVEYSTAPLGDVAVRAKPMPEHFINPEGNFPTPECLDYLRPLVGELPVYTNLRRTE